MDAYETQNNRLSDELAAKVSRLKHVSDRHVLDNPSHSIGVLLQVAYDIEKETKEHNRFLQSMVEYPFDDLIFPCSSFLCIDVRFRYCP